MSARRALVTGAGGFIGANLCRWLLRDGHAVHAVVRPVADGWRLAEIRRDIVLHQLDLRDVGAVRALVEAVGPDWVFHLAAHGAYSWQTDRDAIATTNTTASAGLVDLAAAGACEALVQAGSTAEHGVVGRLATRAELPDPYAASKAAATAHARRAAVDSGMHIVTLRLATAYGPWEDPRRLMPALAVHGLRGRLPPLTEPRTVRDFVFVDDVCAAFARAACVTELERGSVLDIGSGAATSLAELVELVRRELAIAEPPRWATMAPRGWEPQLRVVDGSDSWNRLGWRPRLGLAEGFRALVEWLRRESALQLRYRRSSELAS